MTASLALSVDIGSIEVGFRLRAVDPGKVEALKASFAEIGLQVPITIRPKPGMIGQWLLVAGAHRLEAARQAGMDRIDCLVIRGDEIDAELWEIDENLCRADLTPADRAIFTHRRKDLYLQKHPETAVGRNQHSRVPQVEEGSEKAERFTAATAKATGVSEQTVQRDAARGASISERALQMMRGTRLDTGATLDRVKALPDDMQEIWVKAALDDEKRIQAEAKDIRGHKQKANHEGRLRHMALVAEAGNRHAAKVGKHYPIIYADPPWRFGVHSEVTGREKSAENHYPTMDTDAICRLLETAAVHPARDAVCFLWATNPMLKDGLRVLEAWGFAYVHHWIWDKEVAGTGYWGRDRHELLLIGRRGCPATPLPGSQPETVYRERKGRHSAKPDWFAEQIERLYPGVPRIEVFCRSPRPGWDAWGFEATGEAGQIDEIDLSREGPTATPPEGARDSDVDALYTRAVEIVRETGKPNPSMLQRRLGLGYNDAARLIDRMVAEKVLPLPRVAKPASGRRAQA